MDSYFNLLYFNCSKLGIAPKSITCCSDNTLAFAEGNKIMKMNLNGDTLWMKDVYSQWFYFDLNNLKETFDKGLICCGRFGYNNTISGKMGWNSHR